MDFPFELVNVRDDTTFERDGAVKRWKTATFYLGKTGPYTERMTPEEYLAGELNRRVDGLRNTLQMLPR